MGTPICCRLQACLPTTSSKHTSRQSGLPLRAAAICPPLACHHALKFCITKQAKGEGGCSYHLCMPSLWVRDSGLAKPAQVLLSAGISASLGVLPACRG